jgi:catechol 2,3-dioxygenase-like lactoylglutathione lyase family enzyme
MTPIPRMLSINAITLATHDMAQAVRFYGALGFQVESGDERTAFTSFAVGPGHLNLTAEPPERRWSWWGRVIVFVEDVDALYTHARTQGLEPSSVPRDAAWGERFFHITDPDGHELSFAQPLGVRRGRP